ncbi:MAG: HEAT repeat domain-containing protein [Phycisphaerales bacterium]|nr:HEAT repeat domain-containing protein [Phycisphaerales bacterium]
MSRARVRAGLWIGGGAALLATIAGILMWPMIADAVRNRRAASLLASEDAAGRMRGAWMLLPSAGREHFDNLRDRLLRGEEPDERCREAYVYALGRSGMSDALGILMGIRGQDDSPRVRGAALFAMTRLDQTMGRAFVRRTSLELSDQPGGGDPWERLGLLQARIVLNDLRGMEAAFVAARAEDADLRLAGSRVLTRVVRPLLEISGSWPIDAADRAEDAMHAGWDEGEDAEWPVELVDEVERRCRGLNLQAIYDASTPHTRAAERVHRDVRRLTSARERMRRFLFRD